MEEEGARLFGSSQQLKNALQHTFAPHIYDFRHVRAYPYIDSTSYEDNGGVVVELIDIGYPGGMVLGAVHSTQH